MTREEIQDHVPEEPLKEWGHLCSLKERRPATGHKAATVNKPEAWPMEGSPYLDDLNFRDADQGMAARLKEGSDSPRHPKME